MTNELSKYIIYRDSDGYVENICMWDGVSEWEPPVGCSVERVSDTDSVGVGYTRTSKGTYTAPVTEFTPMTNEELLAELESRLGVRLQLVVNEPQS